MSNESPMLSYGVAPSRWRSRKAIVAHAMILVIAVIALTFLPFWPASNYRGKWRTSLWMSDYFVIYD